MVSVFSSSSCVAGLTIECAADTVEDGSVRDLIRARRSKQKTLRDETFLPKGSFVL